MTWLNEYLKDLVLNSSIDLFAWIYLFWLLWFIVLGVLGNATKVKTLILFFGISIMLAYVNWGVYESFRDLKSMKINDSYEIQWHSQSQAYLDRVGNCRVERNRNKAVISSGKLKEDLREPCGVVAVISCKEGTIFKDCRKSIESNFQEILNYANKADLDRTTLPKIEFE